jgi:hypothetical protein
LWQESIEASYDSGHRGDDDVRGAVGMPAVHGSQPVFRPAVVGLDPFVDLSFDVMPRGRHQLFEHCG